VLDDPIFHFFIIFTLKSPCPENTQGFIKLVSFVAIDNFENRKWCINNTGSLMLVFLSLFLEFLEAFVASNNGVMMFIMASELVSNLSPLN
jgi:hypothetical protein